MYFMHEMQSLSEYPAAKRRWIGRVHNSGIDQSNISIIRTALLVIVTHRLPSQRLGALERKLHVKLPTMQGPPRLRTLYIAGDRVRALCLLQPH